MRWIEGMACIPRTRNLDFCEYRIKGSSVCIDGFAGFAGSLGNCLAGYGVHDLVLDPGPAEAAADAKRRIKNNYQASCGCRPIIKKDLIK